MTGDGHVLELAKGAAEAVSESNHLTRDPRRALQRAGRDVLVVGELTVLAGRLP